MNSNSIILHWTINEEDKLASASLSASQGLHPSEVIAILEHFRECVAIEYRAQIHYLSNFYTDQQITKLIDDATMNDICGTYKTKQHADVTISTHEHSTIPPKQEQATRILKHNGLRTQVLSGNQVEKLSTDLSHLRA